MICPKRCSSCDLEAALCCFYWSRIKVLCNFMVGISYSQTVVSISTVLMILMFIPDFKKKLFSWNQPFFIRAFSLWWRWSPHSTDSKPVNVFISGYNVPFDVIQQEFCVSLCLPSFQMIYTTATVMSLWFCLGAFGVFDASWGENKMNQRDYFGDDAALLLNAASGGVVIPHLGGFHISSCFWQGVSP